MSAAPITSLTCADGAMVDLLNPQIADVKFPVICEHLAKANRYCGATAGLAYSVAQHSVLCAQSALSATSDRELAAYLLCHDMHEAWLGDDTTPKKRALSAIIASFGLLSSAIGDAFSLLTDRVDAVIHAKAGLQWPPSKEMAAEIHRWDRILLATEWRDLMKHPAPYDFGYEPLRSQITPWGWRSAAQSMLSQCDVLLGRR